MSTEETGAAEEQMRIDEEQRRASFGLASTSGGLNPPNGGLLQPQLHIFADQRMFGSVPRSETAAMQTWAQPPSHSGPLPHFHGGQAPSQSAPAPPSQMQLASGPYATKSSILQTLQHLKQQMAQQ